MCLPMFVCLQTRHMLMVTAWRKCMNVHMCAYESGVCSQSLVQGNACVDVCEYGYQQGICALSLL
jgi:hypothetical protein